MQLRVSAARRGRAEGRPAAVGGGLYGGSSGRFAQAGARAAALLAAALLSACLAAVGLGYEVAPLGDDFNQLHGQTMRHNFLGGTPTTGGRVALDAAVGERGDTTLHLLSVHYIGNEWLFVEEGESLILLLDGERVGVPGEGSRGARDVGTGAVLQERATYAVTADLLRRIAAADSVRVRVVGSRRNADRYFTEENKARFRAFVQEYVTPEP